MKRKIIIEIISFLFILLFVYASLNKLTDYQKFVIQLGQSPLLIGLGPYVAWLVISLELVIAFFLAVPHTRLIGFYGAFTLMVMFTVYIVTILNFSHHVPCSCGGVLEKLGWNEHLMFNVCFVVLGATGAILEVKERNLTLESDAV